jgi:hypothetical protein
VLGPCGGAAIKLAPVTDMLVVAEGIETALTAIRAGMPAVWAMGSAGSPTRLREGVTRNQHRRLDMAARSEMLQADQVYATLSAR